MSQVAKQTEGKKRLSPLDWFGLVSGILGLVADIIALLSVFAFVSPASATQNANLPGFVWVFILSSIFYTHIILCFYVRRYFHLREERLNTNIFPNTRSEKQKRQDKIEEGMILIEMLVSAPVFIVLIFITFSSDSSSSSDSSGIIMPILFGFAAAMFASYLAHSLAKIIYYALNPDQAIEEEGSIWRYW
jgi:hypothetical protein